MISSNFLSKVPISLYLVSDSQKLTCFTCQRTKFRLILIILIMLSEVHSLIFAASNLKFDDNEKCKKYETVNFKEIHTELVKLKVSLVAFWAMTLISPSLFMHLMSHVLLIFFEHVMYILYRIKYFNSSTEIVPSALYNWFIHLVLSWKLSSSFNVLLPNVLNCILLLSVHQLKNVWTVKFFT